MQPSPASDDPTVSASGGSSKPKLRLVLVGVLLSLAVIVLGNYCPKTLQRINHSFTDLQIGLLSPRSQPPAPIIVEVDERSLATYGQWPWPRYLVARLLVTIHQAGAAAVGVDAIFAERDRTSPQEIRNVLSRDFKQTLALSGIEQSLWDYDTILGETLSRGPFVVSYFFGFSDPTRDTNSCSPKSAGGAWLASSGNNDIKSVTRAKYALCNVPPIQEHAEAGGFINANPDNDGLYRRTPLIIEYRSRLYPSLALQTFLTAYRLDNILLSPSENGLELHAGKFSIPLDQSANLLIKFPSHAQNFERISAADALQGNLNAGLLKNRIVFVGFSATGLHEVRPTPYSPQTMGVDLHAAVADNIVNQDFLFRPAQAEFFELSLAALLSLALFTGLSGAGLFLSISIPSILIVTLLLGSQLILTKTGAVLSPAMPVLMTAVSFLCLILTKYIGEYRRAKQLDRLVTKTQEGIIGSFCSMSEYRDPETGAHIKRTQEYVKAIAQQLRNHPDFKDRLNTETIELMFKAAPLHDIGKIGIRDHILLKNDRLNDSEFDIMKSHPQIGADIIESVANQIGWNPFMQTAHDISLYHQEKWDGSGYPKGLSGDAIPLAARLMALADVYDALISKRVYKPAFSHNKAVTLISEGKGKHFDPRITDAFLAIHEKFRDIALNFSDNDEQRQTLLAEHSE